MTIYVEIQLKVLKFAQNIFGLKLLSVKFRKDY